jgi:hypothetical protein
LHCYSANGLPKRGKSDVIAIVVENRGLRIELSSPATARIEIGDERLRRNIVSETIASPLVAVTGADVHLG